ncbi:MAG: hypothetical protein K0U60_00695 [Actinomycetia bacterium]|nr:hypothetical protein [Actinomycetes bacterium]MCH9800445.1 hypothetical protein [Actinomycetes bacterium]
MANSAFRAIDIFAEANAIPLPGRQLAAITQAAPAFHDWFADSGTAAAVTTCDLIGLPYPTQYALFRAKAAVSSPYVRITNRMLVVQFFDFAGELRTMLVGPTDVDLAGNTGYFADFRRRLPGPLAELAVRRYPTVLEHLAELDISPEQIDYITFDHLHTQDLRRWLGTDEIQPDLAAAGFAPLDEPVQPIFPNAQLLIMRPEWEQFPQVHPLQRRWFQGHTHAAVRPDKVVTLDSDVLLGPGVALVATPGHTVGNHTVVLNTSSGVWTSSENGMMPEAYDPQSSAIPGLRDYFVETKLEVVLNSNTPESSAVQYNSMIKEKLIAGRGGPTGEHVQHFCSSEMSPWLLARRNGPGHIYESLQHGRLVPSGTGTTLDQRATA